MMKEFALKQIHWRLAKDPWTQAIFEVAGISFDIQAQRIIDIYHSYDFEKMNLRSIQMYEKMLGIVPDEEKSLADRRAYIAAMWKKGAPATQENIQSICDGWLNGECDVEAGPGYVEITFNSVMGVPTDLATLQKALLQVVPAHLEVRYNFKYLLVGEVHEVMTLAEMDATPMGYFAG